MASDPLAALREAAADGVEFDGLEAHLDGERLHIAAAGSTASVEDDRPGSLSEAVVPYVTNWYYWKEIAPERPAGWTFLRWLERATDEADPLPVPDRYDALATGVERSWGQTLLTTTLGDDGRRRYAVRHVDDADESSATLDVHDDPHAAQEIARYDECGRYRPLKTAPTLKPGWIFPDLGAEALLSVIGELYPATVANWYRERTGNLDVTHYRETAERQTGRYRSIADLSVDGVEWAAEACCVDAACLKRRLWDEDAETELDVARGDGEFPCREPCSLFVAAAKQWTDLESEQSRTYTFELTPSEKAQLEALVDAVADGRIEECRQGDLDEGANRYRARYLRAKRFEDGRLPDASNAVEDSADE